MAANTRLEIIGSAVGGIAHDLNNQLTLILNYLAFSDLEGARDAAARCCALTGALLVYRCGKMPALLPMDPVPFLRNFVADLELPPHVQLLVSSPEVLPAIDTDPLALHHVLTNLISNACAAMNDAGVLRIVCRAGTISVEDTGPGISARNLPNVFEPFFTTKGTGGMGLGLAVVREIMQQRGGAVSVHSEPGKGARFDLQFRICTSD
jgi:two-component system, cell cycle sensor histidine kinase and response regulator CckA